MKRLTFKKALRPTAIGSGLIALDVVCAARSDGLPRFFAGGTCGRQSCRRSTGRCSGFKSDNMLMRTFIRHVSLSGAVLLAEVVCFGAEKPLSVCEVLSDLSRYRGKLVTIQGSLRGGTRHGWYLRDNASEKPCTAVGHQGHTWPSNIALAEYTYGSEIEDGPAHFESEATQIESVLSEPKRVANGRDDLEIVVTLGGELRSRKNIKIIRSNDGWYAGDGYGQSGQYPALLIIKYAQDAKAMKKP